MGNHDAPKWLIWMGRNPHDYDLVALLLDGKTCADSGETYQLFWFQTDHLV
jgi:hypothetical protein